MLSASAATASVRPPLRRAARRSAPRGTVAGLVRRRNISRATWRLRQRMISLFGLALERASCDVGLGARVAGHAHENDAPQGVVGLSIAAAVEPVTGHLAGGGLDGAGAAQSSEGGFGAHALRVVAGGDQQRGGDFGADAVGGEQGRVDGGAKHSKLGVEFVDLGAELQVPTRQGAQGELGGLARVCRIPGPEARAAGDALVGVEVPQPGSKLVGGGDDQVADLVGGLCAGLDRRAAREAQHPHALHWPAARFGCSRRVSPLSAARAAASASTVSDLP